MLSDLRFALRSLRRNRSFAVIAVLTLALGIGANAAIFSVVNAVLLRPLPFAEPDRLVQIFHIWEGSRHAMSPANVVDVGEQSAAIEAVTYYRPGSVTLTGQGDPARLSATRVSESFFQLLGTRPLLGRLLLPADNAPGGHRVAVLTHGVWQQRFGGDPGVVGQMVSINEEPYEVVGVMPAEATYPADTEIWLPEPYENGVMGGGNRAMWYVAALGRLGAGAEHGVARAEVEAIGRRLEAAYPEANARTAVTVVPLEEVLVGDLRLPLLVLLGAVGLVLLIACANVANLLLARAAARETEFAVRSAIGAGRGRLTRQLLTESLLLAMAGGAVGLALAAWGTRVLLALAPSDLPRLGDVALDLDVVLFTAVISIGTGLVFGVVPSLLLTRKELFPALRAGGRGQLGGRAQRRVRNAFVMAQTAFAVMLLVAAGLLLRSFRHLQQVDTGFRAEGILSFRLSLPGNAYDTEEERAVFYAGALARLQALPGVTAAAATQRLPMKDGGLNLTFEVRGRAPGRTGENLSSPISVATQDYFSALAIPLLRGRTFGEGDHATAPYAFVITEEAARQFFPGEDPLGQQITVHWGSEHEHPVGTIVGIVGDVRSSGIVTDPEPTIYLAHAQQPVGSMDIILRSSTPTASLTTAAATAIGEIDPTLPLYEVRPLEAIVADTIAPSRFYTLLLSVFGGTALLLAAIGIFGVISYTIRQRTREIGVRLALGADPTRILGMVVRNAAVIASGGLLFGLAGALAASRLLGGLLYGVRAADPITFGAVAVLLMAVALLASAFPAHTATRVEPVTALRGD